MTQRQLKTGYFVLAALNTLANCYFFNYLVFYLRDRFGFGNRENLWASALYGLIYPERRLQERLYSILPFLAMHGLDLIERIHEGIDLECPDHRVLVL